MPLDVGIAKCRVLALLDAWQQGLQGVLDISHDTQGHRMSPPDVRRVDVNLDDRSVLRIELLPGEVGSEEQQGVAVENGLVARLHPDDSRHTDVVRVVVLEHVLTPGSMGDGRSQARCELYHLVVGPTATRAGIDGNVGSRGEQTCYLLQVGVTRTDYGKVDVQAVGKLVRGVGLGHIDRHDEYGHTPTRQGGLAGRDGQATRRLRCNDHFAENTTALEYGLEVYFLDEVEAQLAAHDLAGDQDDRGAIAVGLVQAVDEMQAPGSATTGHRGEAIREQRFALRCKGARLLVAHVYELDVTA